MVALKHDDMPFLSLIKTKSRLSQNRPQVHKPKLRLTYSYTFISNNYIISCK